MICVLAFHHSTINIVGDSPLLPSPTPKFPIRALKKAWKLEEQKTTFTGREMKKGRHKVI